MEKEIKVVTLIDDDGVEFELDVLQEFEHKGKKYAVLYEEVECDCGDECEECSETIYIYEVNTSKDGKEEYVEVSDKTVMNELVEIVENLLYKGEDE